VTRRIFVVLFISTLVSMMGVGVIAPFLSTYAANLGADGKEIGFIFGCFALARAIFTPLLGRWSDLRGRKAFILGGLVLFSLFSYLYSITATVLALAAVRFLHGASSAMVTPIAMAYAADIAPAEREGEHLGTFSISLFLGMASGPILGGTIASWYGEDAVFSVMGILTAAVALFVAVALPDRKPSVERRTRRIREMIRERPIQGLMLFRITNSVMMATLFAFLPLLAADRGLGPQEVGLLLTIYMVAAALLQRPFGRLADRGGKVRLIVVGNTIKIAGYVLLPLAHGWGGWLACVLIMSLGTGLAIPASTALTAILGRERGMGTLIGLFNTAMSVGMGAGPLLAGVLADLYGIEVVFPALGGVALLLTILVAGFLRGLGGTPAEAPPESPDLSS